MSAYIKLSTSEYPRYEGDIRLDYPDMGEDFVCPDTYAVVNWVDRPSIESNQISYELAPESIDGNWHIVWGVRNLTQEEIDIINQPRNNLDNSGSVPNVIG